MPIDIDELKKGNADRIAYTNKSLDNKVAFIEDGHKYVLISNPSFKWKSVTQVLKDYKEPFDAVGIAKKMSRDKTKPQYYGRTWEDIAKEWNEGGIAASKEGTVLHQYGEDLLNRVKDIHVPDLPKTKYIQEAVDKIFADGYELAKTEILVYDVDVAVAGQSDILLKKRVEDEGAHFSDTPVYNYMIFDWKFLKRPIEKKSYYNRKTGYKLMTGPFKYLQDCNWIHYSIQLAIYQTLMGIPEKVKEKVLVVVTPDGVEFVPTYPMRVYWNRRGELHAAYEIYNGSWYVSEDDRLYKNKPSWIRGL